MGLENLLVLRPDQAGTPVLGLAVVFGTMNLSLYSAIDRIGLGLAVTLEFLGPLTIALAAATGAIVAANTLSILVRRG